MGAQLEDPFVFEIPKHRDSQEVASTDNHTREVIDGDRSQETGVRPESNTTMSSGERFPAGADSVLERIVASGYEQSLASLSLSMTGGVEDYTDNDPAHSLEQSAKNAEQPDLGLAKEADVTAGNDTAVLNEIAATKELFGFINGIDKISHELDRERQKALSGRQRFSISPFRRSSRLKVRNLRDLQEREASIGSNVYVSDKSLGVDHQFHYLGRTEEGVPEWLWHRYWRDDNGKEQVLTTRYEILTETIVKIQDGLTHREIESSEAAVLYGAVCRYYKLVIPDIYS